MKLTKAFTCVLSGEIYPIVIAAGGDCPSEHEDSAHAQGCIDDAEYEAGVALRPQAEDQASATSDEEQSGDSGGEPPATDEAVTESPSKPSDGAAGRKNSRA